MKTRTRREIVLSETRVGGTYRYNELFQLCPMLPEAPALLWGMGHHPFLLEYSYDLPEVSETNYNPAIPERVLLPMIDDEASARTRKWILILLSTFNKSRIFQYPTGPQQQQWFMRLPKDDKDTDASHGPYWGQAGYIHNGIAGWIVEDFSAHDIQTIKLVESNEYYRTETPRQYVIGKTSDLLELPDRINEFFDYYAALPADIKKGFLSACLLFDQGIQLFFTCYVRLSKVNRTDKHRGACEHCVRR